MNNYNFRYSIVLLLCICCNSFESVSQTLKPNVIASAGGVSTNSGYSLSYTIGETNTATLTNSSIVLTQGFQQPFKLILNVKAFLQGYYKNAGLMENVLFNEGITAIPSNLCDTIEIELREPVSPYTIVSSSKHLIQTNGTVTFSGNANIGNSYYIVLKHRNTIETWSADPITILPMTNYDFTTSANQAYGNNQVEVESGVWALYSGDINQDENIDLLDASFLEVDINNFEFGYFSTDINGDGNVDLLDAPIVESNINNFIFSLHPF